MKKEVTYKQLYIHCSNLRADMASAPGIAFLFQEKINRFFQQNAMSIKVLNSRLAEIQKKYIEHDEKGHPQMEAEVEGQPARWLFKPSVVGANGQLITGEAVKEAYEGEFELFMNRSITVVI